MESFAHQKSWRLGLDDFPFQLGDSEVKNVIFFQGCSDENMSCLDYLFLYKEDIGGG